MEVVSKDGIIWHLARLWRVDTWEQSRDLERRLKRWSGSGQFCPICKGLPVDDDVFMRRGHMRLAWRNLQGRRRPMPGGMLMNSMHLTSRTTIPLVAIPIERCAWSGSSARSDLAHLEWNPGV
jgi:hypothetical protein